jgi:ubiquinone/menaquinone biosynthesis C-methylase UbiE
MNIQVDRTAYNFQKYCDSDRWASYWRQIKEVLSCAPKNILEIGVGDRVFSSYLKNNTDIKYISLDIASDLQPDVIASIDKIPFPDNSFDTVCAFEVLEHLPWEKFKGALSELYRVSNSFVIISLPHWGRHFSCELRLPFFKKIRFQYKFSFFPIPHRFDGQHYWEIGKRGYPLRTIKEQIKNSGFKIKNDYICFYSPYHHFFILEK